MNMDRDVEKGGSHEKAPAELVSLPPEIIFQIVRHLSKDDVLPFCLTNQYLCAVTRQRIWHSISVRVDTYSLDKIEDAVSFHRWISQPSILPLVRRLYASGSRKPNDIMGKSSIELVSLQELKIALFCYSGLENCVESQLEWLQDLISAAFEKKTMRVLLLSCIPQDAFPPTSESRTIRSLFVSKSEYSFIKPLILALPNLRHLKLANNKSNLVTSSHQPSGSLAWIGNELFMRPLECLELDHVARAEMHDILQAFDEFDAPGSLERLSIDCTSLTPSDITSVLRTFSGRLPELRSFELLNIPKRETEEMGYGLFGSIAVAFPMLAHLKIHRGAFGMLRWTGDLRLYAQELSILKYLTSLNLNYSDGDHAPGRSSDALIFGQVLPTLRFVTFDIGRRNLQRVRYSNIRVEEN
ncbi:hypothetical protein BT69DRAFT_293913 [Atractiella rhizophila]|nr:hypothetical protein BT69DRAFT_293913 [Atractiella rhizophila]